MYLKDYNGDESWRENREMRERKSTKDEREHSGCWASIWEKGVE